MTNDDADDSDAPDDPVTRSMRSVWLTMREEDPPTRGLADLMIAARAKAEALQPREPWWRRAFAVMLRPPVLALATVVVLVGGAVVINHRGANLESPTRSFAGGSSGVEQKPAEEPTRSLERQEALGGAGSAATPGSLPVAATGQASEPPSLVLPSSIERPAIKEPTKGESTREKVGVKSKGTVEGKPDGRGVNGKAADAVKLEIGEPAGLEFGGLVIAKDDAPTTDSTAASIRTPAIRTPAVPAPPPKDAIQADGEAVTQTSADVRSARSQGPSVEQLVMQAEVAAGRKDCPAVRVTVDRIKKLDANVYKARVAKQAAIARCLK